MAARRITERRAAHAARQILYHQERIRWMAERMETNAAALETYLAAQGKEAAVLPGGYAVGITDAGDVAVQEPAAGSGYEQLKIPDLMETEHTAGNKHHKYRQCHKRERFT